MSVFEARDCEFPSPELWHKAMMTDQAYHVLFVITYTVFTLFLTLFF